jgi:ABC-2 type transport system permease protein
MASRPLLHSIVLGARAALPLLGCGLATFILLVPASTAAVPQESIFNVVYTHEQLKFRFYHENFSLACTIAVLVYGMALAWALFAFLRDKRATTAYLSVGISRLALFVHRFGAGVVALCVGIGLPFAVSLALNVYALGWYEGELAAFAYVLGGYLVSGLIAFALASLACVCAGTLFECVAFSVTLLAGVSSIAWGYDGITAQLLVGSPFGKLPFGASGAEASLAPSLLEAGSVLNPALFFADLGAAHQVFYVMHPVYVPPAANWAPVVGWAFCALLVAVVTALLLWRRPGEQAQMAGLNIPLTFLTAAFAAFSLFAALFFALAPINVVVALVLGGMGFVALSLLLLRGPLRGRAGRARSLSVLALECLCTALCVAVVATGGLGFSAWVPATEEVERLEVSYVGAPSYLACPLEGTASNASYYYRTEYAFSDAEDIEVVCAAHARLIEVARAPLARGGQGFESTVVRYDLVLRYVLRDGSERVRYFDRARIADLQSLLVLDDSAHVRALERAVITGAEAELADEERTQLARAQTALAFRSGAVYVTDANYNAISSLELGEVERAALLRALASDVVGQSADERYAQPQQPCAVLMFTNSPQTDVATFGFSFANAVVPVGPGFTQTLAWFEQNGLGAYRGEGVEPALIEEIAWLEEDPYASVVNSGAAAGSAAAGGLGGGALGGAAGGLAGAAGGAVGGAAGGAVGGWVAPTSRFFMTYRSEVPGSFWAAPDFGVPATTRDATEIAELAPRLRTACFMGGGYLVQAKLRGAEVWVHYYLPADDAPPFMGAAGMEAMG